MKTAYVTADRIGTGSGGGQVVQHELEALRESSDVAGVLEARDLAHPAYAGLDIPFLQDVRALHLLASARVFENVQHVHFYSGCFTQTVRYLRARGVKVSYTSPAHDRAVTMDEFRRQGLPYPYPHIADDALWPMMIGGALEADLTIAPSQAAADFLRAQGARSVQVIPHGADIPDSFQIVSKDRSAGFQAGYLGQTGPDKGLPYLIEAWDKCGVDGVLHFAGRGTEALEDMIRRHANKARFRLHGYVPDRSAYLSALDLYVQPSVTESFGIEIVEALGHGVPVVSSDGAGACDVLRDHHVGMVVPARSVEAIAAAIKGMSLLWALPEPWALARAQCLQAAQPYTWQQIRLRYREAWSVLWT